ncbi:hypothetical protein [Limnoglobus roseus]|uniref:Uncharacterized protein n=1 Tax=Limnoglobus roseus TaxID=2598579 RepID=A0A5C1ACR1_9BACT|nr:hypothetical protein [Limnoglobus roseus]QEL16530.1 hypothetical protein PX52LOC_03489 [Limnoglobus roseus]
MAATKVTKAVSVPNVSEAIREVFRRRGNIPNGLVMDELAALNISQTQYSPSLISAQRRKMFPQKKKTQKEKRYEQLEKKVSDVVRLLFDATSELEDLITDFEADGGYVPSLLSGTHTLLHGTHDTLRVMNSW